MGCPTTQWHAAGRLVKGARQVTWALACPPRLSLAGLAAGMDMLVEVSFAIYPTFVASQATAIFFSVAFANAEAEADTITDF